ncbi:hypothetical protein J7T55_007595 [Diaporthe amygdali]|uniref:uncharacterized protein n=1 Tax=Phomopsis amygdali TaxID=1214568 RepID=UPI0022FE91BC|nr:uncharacterized protein J7T55_007595 [Diaporthe amygdali]KAJ0107225.1 hypothetical protein J7T55_007595 [Diaporthe amygdali]
MLPTSMSGGAVAATVLEPNTAKWKTTFKSVWKTFETQFRPILDSLDRRRELLESEKGSATLHEISKAREDIAAFIEETKKQASREGFENHKWRLNHIKEKLEAPDYQLDQEMATEDRNGSVSGTWILQNPSFQKWTDKHSRDNGVLYLSGIPGAGKTTLASFIVERLLEESCAEGSDCDTLVAYFYFKHNQADKQTHNSFLRAMMEQIVTRDLALSDHLFDNLATINEVNLRSTRTLESLIATSFEHFRTCLIIMDGLDEAAPGEAIKLLNWILPVANGQVQDNMTSTRLLFCGQRDGILDHRLANYPHIALESVSDHDMDINNYCAQIGARIRSKFSIPSDMERKIVSQVTLQAHVAFRYERVAVRIFEESPPAEREDATKILGWLTCAERLLHWREIQAIFCIDPDTSQVDYEGERLRMSCKQLCGSLVDIHHAQIGHEGPDDVLQIVHGTAREYLIQNRWINISLEHAKAATFCFRYLISKPFHCGSDDKQILLHAKKGYYAFQDYSVRYCLDHVSSSVRLSPSYKDQMTLNALEPARDFLKSYSLSAKFQLSSDEIADEKITHFIKELPKHPRDRFGLLNIGLRTVNIRGQIEEMRNQDLTSEELYLINNLYGLETTFKCPKPWCNYFTTGFETRKDRTKHVNCHERPFCCPEEGCFASQFGFDVQEKLKQHTAKHHCTSTAEVRFPKRKAPKRWANIHEAASEGNVAGVLAFLDTGTDPDARNNPESPSSLYLAAESGHFEVCKLLLTKGAQLCLAPWGQTATPLECALRYGSLDIIHLFLGQPELETSQAIRNLPRWIHAASCHDDSEVLKLVLESPVSRHVNTNDIDEDERNSIKTACLEGPYTEFCRYLLEHGFSKLVTSDTSFDAYVRGVEYGVDLPQPIIDRTTPPPSFQTTDQLLLSHGIDPSELDDEQKATFQSQSPAVQQKTLETYKANLPRTAHR